MNTTRKLEKRIQNLEQSNVPVTAFSENPEVEELRAKVEELEHKLQEIRVDISKSIDRMEIIANAALKQQKQQPQPGGKLLSQTASSSAKTKQNKLADLTSGSAKTIIYNVTNHSGSTTSPARRKK